MSLVPKTDQRHPHLAHWYQTRSNLLQQTRAFFYQQSYVEVDVLPLNDTGVTDPFVDSLRVIADATPSQPDRFLMTSPETKLKQHLANGCGDCFFLGAVYRDDPVTLHHRSAFNLLEWYALNVPLDHVIDQTTTLIQQLARALDHNTLSVTHWHWMNKLEEALAMPYNDMSIEHLADFWQRRLGAIPAGMARETSGNAALDQSTRQTWLQWIWAEVFERHLPNGIVILQGYSCEFAQLATTDEGSTLKSPAMALANRFECYVNGVEIANGYHELQDKAVHEQRFATDNRLRQALDKPQMPMDQPFMQALAKGLPPCCGVALGFDRLLQMLTGVEDIGQIQHDNVLFDTAFGSTV